MILVQKLLGYGFLGFHLDINLVPDELKSHLFLVHFSA